MKSLTHSPRFETMFDSIGVTSLASGTAPHNPDENRIVIQNTEVNKFTSADDEACSAASKQSLYALKKWISNNFYGADERAKKSLKFAIGEE